MVFFFKIFFSTPGHRSHKHVHVYSNDDQGRVYQNLIFMTPLAGFLLLECGHISHIDYDSENVQVLFL